jgi:acyl-CoA thioester hydrolase
VAYPDNIEVGVSIAKLGNSSLNYQLAIFKEGDDLAIATGHFVHVFVDRVTQKPRPIPEAMRTGITPFLTQAS